MEYFNLKIPYFSQGKDSANCGPCTLKMLAAYYHLRNPSGGPFSLSSLNRLCKVSKVWGTGARDYKRVAARLGLKMEKIPCGSLKKNLKRGRPVVAVFLDETGEGHYALIKGVDRDKLIFHDSYFGPNFRRPLKQFKRQAYALGNWIYAVYI